MAASPPFRSILIGVTIVIAFLYSSEIMGQSEKRLAIFSGTGSVVQHSPIFIENPGSEASYQLGLTYYYKRMSDENWRKKSRFPEIGTTLLYTRFGNNKTYGNAISLIPSLNINIYSSSKSDLTFNIGTGLSYLSKTYYNTDGNNLAIGSHWNNASNLSFAFHRKLCYGTIYLNLGLTHFSNTAIRQPNVGLNLVRLNLGTSWNLSPRITASKIVKAPLKLKPWNFAMKVQAGIFDYEERQYDLTYKYAGVYSFNLVASFRTSTINRAFSGMRFTYNDGRGRRNGPNSAKVISFFIGDEITLGHFGYYGQIGYYLRQKYNPNLNFYTEFGIHYFPSKTQKGIFMGIHIKNHIGVAEYPGLSLGYMF